MSAPPGEPADIAAAARTMYGDWIRPASTEDGPWLRRTSREPGTIALRARWHYLRQLDAPPINRAAHEVTEDQWRREIDLENEADLALVRHDLDTARARFSELADTASHPMVLVEALIGLADVARHDDDMGAAEPLYRQAAEIASDIGFDFGAMRACLPLAYLVRRSGSAEQMLSIAEECEASARALNDRVYIANALVARGEALDLLGRREEAVQVLGDALDGFEQVGSDVGVAGAGVRLLDVHRRREDETAILRHAPRVLRAIEATGQLQEAVDVYDVLAYAHLKRDDPESALRACQAGISLGEARYPRAIAHLRMTEGLALRRIGRPDDAAQAELEAYNYFRDRPDDQGPAAYCLGHLAACAEDMDLPGEAVELQLRAIEAVEQIRSEQRRPRWQQEYRTRFDVVYRQALETVVRAGDPIAFVAVFESVWGRRLSGITEGVDLDVSRDPILIAQLLARADQARRTGSPTDTRLGSANDSEARIVRALGRVAVGAALPDMYADATDPALAASFRPLQRAEATALVDQLPAGSALFLITEVPGRPGRIAWLAQLPQQGPMLGVRNLTEEELASIAAWSGAWPLDATAADTATLAGLIPEELRDLPPNTPFQLIPLERLWALPWSAVPVSGGFLGTATHLQVCTSLTLARSVSAPPGPGWSELSPTRCCIGPGVRHHQLRGLGRHAANANTRQAALQAHDGLLRGTESAVVVVAHGRPTAGIGHYLELAPDLILTPTEMLGATAPASVALLACWGARVPEQPTGEPLTLATIALARGARQVLTTAGELGDSLFASSLVDATLSRAATVPWAEALNWALNRRAEDLAAEPLVNWAALIAIGGC